MIAPVPGTLASTCNSELQENPCEGFNGESCGKPSNVKVVGESDSMGDEYYFQCHDCWKKEIAWKKENPTLSDCDWCKACNVKTRPIRDIDEGNHGPVYDVCDPCRENYIRTLVEEMAELDDRDDDYDHQDSEEDDYVLLGAVEIDAYDEKGEPVLLQQTLESITTCDGRYQFAGDGDGYYYWETLAKAREWVAALPDDAEFVEPNGTIWKKTQLQFSCIEHAV